MANNRLFIAYRTIITKEITRFMRIWSQTILPAISMALYFIIFGNLIGPRIGIMGGFSYMEFIAPGIIMMSIINNAYSNVSSSFFGARFQRHIEEMLIAPIPNWIILAGYITGGVLRGLIVGVIVTVIALFFTGLPSLYNPFIVFTIVILTSVLFSLGGFLNGMFANNFDDISIIPTFVLTPLIYLGGVFYSIDLLPRIWQTISLGNPILYMVNAFRYGILGISDISIHVAFTIIILFIIILSSLSLYLLNRGTRIKT